MSEKHMTITFDQLQSFAKVRLQMKNILEWFDEETFPYEVSEGKEADVKRALTGSVEGLDKCLKYQLDLLLIVDEDVDTGEEADDD